MTSVRKRETVQRFIKTFIWDKETSFRVLDLKQQVAKVQRKNAKVKKGSSCFCHNFLHSYTNSNWRIWKLISTHLLSLFEVQQSPLYPHCRSDKAAKKQDMQFLLPFYPPNTVHLQFFKNLPLEFATRMRGVQSEDDNVDEEDNIFYL